MFPAPPIDCLCISEREFKAKREGKWNGAKGREGADKRWEEIRISSTHLDRSLPSCDPWIEIYQVQQLGSKVN
jgi:hypothetical protein